jgi:glycosyltransferase involved in cell wall biosynthesis
VSPGFNASLAGPFRQLITVHDLIHLHVDDESSLAKRLYYERVVLPAIRSAGRVLTGSQFSRNEIINWSGLSPDAVISVGYGSSFAPATTVELDRGAAGDGRMILFVGNSKPHKNFRLLVSSLRYMSDNVRVVAVGAPLEFVAATCHSEGVSVSRFDVRQNVSEADLRELYITAACVGLPSTYEGFGLPALEGMAVGTPTAYICDAVAEVVGPLGFRSHGKTNAEAFAFALEGAIQKGMPSQLIARASTFSWDDSAKLVEEQMAAMRG